jgi:PAS domain S-box-containing protein
MEELYLSICENLDVPLIISNEDMTIVKANTNFEQLTGYFQAEVEGKYRWNQLFNKKDMEKILHRHHRSLTFREKTPKKYQCNILCKHRKLTEVTVTVIAIPGHRHTILAFKQITSPKEFKVALLESERRLSTLISNLPGMAYRSRYNKNNKEWSIEFVSEGWKNLTGYESEDILRNLYSRILYPGDRKYVDKNLRRALSNRERYKIVYRIRTASGEIKWVWDQGIGVFSKNGVLVAVEGFVTDITANKIEEQKLRNEILQLKTFQDDSYKFGDIVGNSSVMQKVYGKIQSAASTDVNVVIYGESGTGKELVANAIHNMSARRDKQFVAMNCSAIPQDLIESEFFGFKKHSFTGAGIDKQGYLDLADGGTLFLDEIGEISPSLQVKLLRAIEGSGFTPIGGKKIHKPDFRIVAATNKNLKEEIKIGRIREDFFYRIHIIPIYLPPLRERKEDLPLLIYHFIKKYSDGKNIPALPEAVMKRIMEYDWPGNVRELQNAIHRYIVFNQIDFVDIGLSKTGSNEPFMEGDERIADNAKASNIRMALDNFEKNYIVRALKQNTFNRTRAASCLGIARRTLIRKMKHHSIS